MVGETRVEERSPERRRAERRTTVHAAVALAAAASLVARQPSAAALVAAVHVAVELAYLRASRSIRRAARSASVADAPGAADGAALTARLRRGSAVLFASGTAAAVAVLLVPTAVWREPWATWAARSAAMLLGVSALPATGSLVARAAIAAVRRRGARVAGMGALEAVARAKLVVVDDSASWLLRGPAVIETILGPEALVASVSPTGALAIAAGIAAHVDHPVADAVRRHVATLGIPLAEVTEVREHAEDGASARVAGRAVHLGPPELFARLGVPLASLAREVDRVVASGSRVALVGDDAGVWLGLAWRERGAAEARAALNRLRGDAALEILLASERRQAVLAAADLGIPSASAADARRRIDAARGRAVLLARRTGALSTRSAGAGAVVLVDGGWDGGPGEDETIVARDLPSVADLFETARTAWVVHGANAVLGLLAALFAIAGGAAGALSIGAAAVVYGTSRLLQLSAVHRIPR